MQFVQTNRAISRSLLAAAFLAVAPSLCFAEASVVDEFTVSPGPIDGAGGGTGFSGNYSGGGSVVSPGLTYPGLQVAGNALEIANINGAFRNLATPIDTNASTAYVSFLMTAPPDTVPMYAGISLYCDEDTEEIFMGKPYLAENYGFDILDESGGLLDAPTAPPLATPSLLVYRLTFTPSGDRIDFFANPTPGADLPATPTLTFDIPEGAVGDTLTMIRLQSFYLDDAPFHFDELRIGGSFADVAPAVPEPAALPGMVICSAILLRWRRRG